MAVRVLALLCQSGGVRVALTIDHTAVSTDVPIKRICGNGGRRDVLTAKVFDAERVIGVELNPAIVEVLRNDFAEHTSPVYDQQGVEIFVDDARRFIADSDEEYDLI
jgi:predicted membrane-bound spermidine synthase